MKKQEGEKNSLFWKNFDFFIFSSMVATQKNVALFKKFVAFSFLLWDEWKVIKANVRGFESRRSIIVAFYLSMFVFRLMSNCTENCNFQGWFIVLSWLCWLEPWACYRTVLGSIPASANLFRRRCCCTFQGKNENNFGFVVCCLSIWLRELLFPNDLLSGADAILNLDL